MDINQRRSFVDNCVKNEVEFRRCCQNNNLKATIQGQPDFNSEAFYTSVGSREILAIFKGGEKNTPLARAFDLYLPRQIETGIYELNKPGNLIEIAFTAGQPPVSRWALEGVMNLFVNTGKTGYTGIFNVKFKDGQNNEFSSRGEFSFVLDS
ncbi:hypothetical protein NYP20_23455 [Pseudomonas sp. N3-W]|jgi:hypothetical protein|uniref:hypothetical protein n=1 Tax=Pseudomonas sp. N3-W TaxID=2975049 RepID=UPI00217CCA50|nr:hypothetical protein [Pseudomonas sp. N3-W]UWF48239.1 hypothetical protein NYP20_23455 [Pseudomonas sp. N3-W]